MENSTLFRVLSTFSDKETKQFELFVNSPYFNKKQVLVDFWGTLKKLIRLKKQKNIAITNEFAFKKLFPKKKYSRSLLSNYSSQLLKLTEQFIVIEINADRKDREERILLEALMKRNLNKYFEIRLNAIQRKKAEKPLKPDNYLDDFREEYLQHEFHLLNHKGFNEDLITNFKSTIRNLDIFIILKKLSLALEIIAIEAVYKTEKVETAFLAEIETIATKTPYAEALLVQIYYQAYLMYKNANDNKTDGDYFKLKAMLLTHQKNLGKRTLKELLTCLGNYANRQINKGRNEFKIEALEIYETMETNNLLFQEPFLFNILNDYRSAVSIACRNNQLDWAKAFIERNKDKIPKYGKDCYNFGIGLYYFYSKQYLKAAKHFNLIEDVESADIYYEINNRFIYIRSIYESDKYFSDESIEIFYTNKAWFERQKRTISLQQADAYINFITIFIKLYRLKYELNRNYKSENQRKLDNIIDLFNAKKAIMSKEWLRKKIDEVQTKV